MHKHLRHLVAAAFALAFAPSIASAAPPSCAAACTGPATCEVVCIQGTFLTTCRGAGKCGTIEDSQDPGEDEEASNAQPSSEESLVCGEEARSSALES